MYLLNKAGTPLHRLISYLSMRLKQVLGPKKRGRKNNQLSHYRTIKCLIISMDEEGDSFSDTVCDTFFPRMLNIASKECEKNEFDVLVEFKKFVFWKDPSILFYDHSALDQYLLFHKCNVVFLTVSKIHQPVITKIIYLHIMIHGVSLLIGKDA